MVMFQTKNELKCCVWLSPNINTSESLFESDPEKNVNNGSIQEKGTEGEEMKCCVQLPPDIITSSFPDVCDSYADTVNLSGNNDEEILLGKVNNTSHCHFGIDLTGDNINSTGLKQDFDTENPTTVLKTPLKGKR